MEEPLPVSKPAEIPKIPSVRATSSGPRTTINLGKINKPAEKTEEKKETTTAPVRIDEPLVESRIRQVWMAYAELRKNQVAEYHLLMQPISIKEHVITLSLTNLIEEPLLVSMRLELVTYLRDQLKNSSIQIESILQEAGSVRKAYTNKEKFEYLAEKNPLLKDFQNKFGLDPDF